MYVCRDGYLLIVTNIDICELAVADICFDEMEGSRVRVWFRLVEDTRQTDTGNKCYLHSQVYEKSN